MAGLPTGSVTFLFSDIQGSTELLQRLGQEAFASVLRACRRTLRTAAAAHGGHEIDARGDEFFAAFASARGALLAAQAAQQAIRAHPWPAGASVRVRMGVHTGEPLTVGDAYVGLDVHRAARICSVAHGGQILLSQTTYNLVVDHLPEGVTLRDLGRHRLKDLRSPEQLFQLVHPDLVSSFPPLRSPGIHPNNLPLQLTSFVGRERERREVADLLRRSRLLTLVGAGGCGKTRLALQVAGVTLDGFPDGTWLIELGALANPSLVPQAVAGELGVREISGRSVTDTLAEELHGRQLLLVLDNCEHLVEACAALAYALLRSCPRLTILATTREPLGVIGEVIYEVPPLSLPDRDEPGGADRVLQSDAVALFVDRALQSNPAFEVTEAHLPPLAQICTMLDGIPLAIELAAAKLRVLSLEEIVSRLDQRFTLLQAGRPTALPRHQTLRAAIEWSHDLLTDRERILLRRLSVFSGGFTLEAAEAVCGVDPIATWDVLEILTRLVEKSTVLARRRKGLEGYRLLETVREYAAEQLAASTEQEAMRARHRAWFLDLVERAEPFLRGPDQEVWLDRLEAEHDNLRATLEWSQRRGDADVVLRLAGLLWWFWYGHGHIAEGRQWLAAAPARRELPAPVRARALLASAHLAIFHGDYHEARSLADQARLAYQELSDRWGVGGAQVILAIIATLSGEVERAAQLSAEALTLFREQKDPWASAYALSFLGLAALNAGDLPGARSYFGESFSIFRTLGDRVALAFAISHLGLLARAEGRNDDAVRFLGESLATFEGVGDRWGAGYVLGLLGVLADAQGSSEAADRYFQRSLAVRRSIGDRRGAAQCLVGLARVARARGQQERAHALLVEALVIRQGLADHRGMFHCLTDLAGVAAAWGQHQAAARLLGAGGAFGGAAPRTAARAAEELAAHVRDQLGPAVFEEMWNLGRQMDGEAVVAYARTVRSTMP